MKIFITLKYKIDNQNHNKLTNMIENQCKKHNHIPFTAYREIDKKGLTSSKEWMPFVKEHIQTSNLMILVYEKGLQGGLVEEGIAYANGINIWLIHQKDEKVSRSVLGCANKIICYSNLSNLEKELSILLSKI